MNQSQLGGRSDIAVSRRPLVWLNVVCLDAPLVAALWQWCFARSFRLNFLIGSRPVLFLTAWLIYLIDRFVDSISLPINSAKTLREAFCFRHKNVWMGMILVVASLDAGFIFARLDHSVFMVGIFLSVVAAVYLTINFAFNKLWRPIPVKEIAIGFVFAAGTLVSFWPQVFRVELMYNKIGIRVRGFSVRLSLFAELYEYRRVGTRA